MAEELTLIPAQRLADLKLSITHPASLVQTPTSPKPEEDLSTPSPDNGVRATSSRGLFEKSRTCGDFATTSRGTMRSRLGEDDNLKDRAQLIDALQKERARVEQLESLLRGNTRERDLQAGATYTQCRRPFPESKADNTTKYHPRITVDDGVVSWDIPFGRSYEPHDFTTGFVLAHSKGMGGGWADPVECSDVGKEEWARRQSLSQHQVTIKFDAEGRPLNPMGRTGLRGRGSLANWGPNFAADIVVTRWKPGSTGILEVLTHLHRTSHMVRALPGGILRDGETMASERTLTLLQNILKPQQCLTQLWKDKTLSVRIKQEKLDAWSYLGTVLVDDPRVTDNAWVESTSHHLHLDERLMDIFPFEPDVLDNDINVAEMTEDEHKSARWIQLDDSVAEGREKLFGNHGMIALKACDKLLPRIAVEPISTSPLISICPAWAGHEDSRDAPKTLVDNLFLEKGFRLITSLLDVHSEQRLMLSLWQDAGKPTFTAELFPEAEPTTLDSRSYADMIQGFMQDRCNWSQYNLQLYSQKHEVLGHKHRIQTLAELQRFTSPSYKPVLAMPVHMLSLAKCNNMSPFSHTLVPTDQLECLSHGQRPTFFHLSLSVFDSGSMLAPRSKLQLIKARLVKKVRNDERDHLIIQASPMSSITLDDTARTLAGIPSDAVFFGISFPHHAFESDADPKNPRSLASLCAGASSSDRNARDRSVATDPFLNFLNVGAYLYFDKTYRIVGISALCFTEIDPRLFEGDVVKKLYYGRPSRLPDTAIRPINQQGRWRRVTVKSIREFGFTHFAWIKPSEFIGDHVFPKKGGFAYLHKNWRDWGESTFFPVISPSDDRGKTEQQLMPNFDLAEDGDESYEPKEFDAPLHIPEYNELARKERQRQASQKPDGSASGDGALTEAQQAEANAKLAEKFISSMDLSEEQQASTLKMADAVQSARGIEQILGFVDTAQLLEHSQKQIQRPESDYWPTDPSGKVHLEQSSKQQLHNIEAKLASNKSNDFYQCKVLLVELCAAIKPSFEPVDGESDTAATKRTTAAVVQAAEYIDMLHYVLCEVASEQRQAANDKVSTAVRDRGRKKEDQMTIDKFARCKEARDCNLSMVEVACLRFYTTSAFALINQPLRGTSGKTFADLQRKRPPMAVTTYHITSGLKKLRALNFREFTHSSLDRDRTLEKTNEEEETAAPPPSAEAPSPGLLPYAAPIAAPPGTTTKPELVRRDSMLDSSKGADKKPSDSSYLWRGLKDVKISDHFMSYGGSELACMSTSESLTVISNYAFSKSPLLFRIKIESPMDRGASLEWLSVYPNEAEVLYPPLTYLQPLLKQKIRDMESGEVVTLKAVFPS